MLQDLSLYTRAGQIVSDAGLTISGALLAGSPGALLAATQYAPSSQTSITKTGTTAPAASMSAWDSTNINTGSWLAPPSGNVLVDVVYSAKSSAATVTCVVGLCEHGTVTPMVGVTSNFQIGSSAGNNTQTLAHRQLVTGLTPGSSHNFDFMGACFTNAGTFILVAMGLTATLTVVTVGGPVVMTVQAV